GRPGGRANTVRCGAARRPRRTATGAGRIRAIVIAHGGPGTCCVGPVGGGAARTTGSGARTGSSGGRTCSAGPGG
ncbi:MAG TPA: hypothetical protein VGG07_07935, partial [Solirubrobacteraceae bacterium]